MNGTKPDRPADIITIRQLYQDGLLSDDAFHAASAYVQPASDWFAWSRQVLLFLGSTLVLAGIIFFFAYNWASIGKFIKFGAIEVGIVACLAGAYYRGFNHISSKVLLLSASVLVGVLLAVYGQVYQTGADDYRIYLGWAALITTWVVISEFAALWILWLIILNISMILFWFQVGGPTYELRHEYLWLALGIVNGWTLALRELGANCRLEWLRRKWTRGVLFTATLVPLSIPVICLAFGEHSARASILFATAVWVAVVVGGYACCRYRLHDMVSLSLIVFNACVILLTFIARLLFDIIDVEGSISFLLYSLIILAVASSAAFWLRRTSITMISENKEATG